MKKILLFLMFFYSSHLFAKTNIPNQLIYKNKPIDALCFLEFESSQKNVALSKCGLKAEKGRKITEINKDLTAKGYIGYDYSMPIDSSMNSNGSSYYKIIGSYKDQYVIYTINNSGGSGEFTHLILVKRNKDNLALNVLTGGDRCNGGIVNPKLIGNSLTFQRNVTPFDFLDLVNANKNSLNAYDDLAACAACCAGLASFMIDLNNPKSQTFKSLNLVNVPWGDEANTQGKYQACFNKSMQQYLQTPTVKVAYISSEELTTAMNNFNQQCISKH